MDLLDSAARFRLRPDVRYRIIDGEAVVIRQDDAEVVVLNGVGARVLELVHAAKPVSALLEVLCAEYQVSQKELERDIFGFLEELLAAGVIEAAHGV